MNSDILVSTFYSEKGNLIKKDSKYFDLNENLTIQDVLDSLNETGLMTDDNYIIVPIKINNSSQYEKRIKYVVHDKKIIWNLKFEECLLKDYVDTYSLSEIKFMVHPFGGMGSLDFSQIEWEVIIEQLKLGSELIIEIESVWEAAKILFLSTKALNNARKYIRNKFLGKKGVVSQGVVVESIKKRTVWSLDEFIFRYDLEDNREFAKFILEILGYVYCSDKNLYFFSEALAEKNNEKFNTIISKHVFEKINMPKEKK